MLNFTVNKYSPEWGSHIPILIKVLDISEGPVLELGMGVFSTPLLHSLCADKKRLLVSCESDKNYFDAHAAFATNMHKIEFVKNWDNIDIENTRWGVAFVDHAPDKRRIVEVRRLANLADYVIIHDSNGRYDSFFHYKLIYPLFKYRYEYGKAMPHTTVLSNFKDLSNL